VIGMGMGEDDAMQFAHARIEQLRPQVWRRVDQNPRDAGVGFALDQQRTAAAAVLRFFRVTIAPVIAKPGDPQPRMVKRNSGIRRLASSPSPS